MRLCTPDYFDSIRCIAHLCEDTCCEAREVVEDPMEADIIVSDRTLTISENAEQIHSYDFSRVLALMNA